jgi:hypothetical protein
LQLLLLVKLFLYDVLLKGLFAHVSETEDRQEAYAESLREDFFRDGAVSKQEELFFQKPVNVEARFNPMRVKGKIPR